jgi:hypothetical protein
VRKGEDNHQGYQGAHNERPPAQSAIESYFTKQNTENTGSEYIYVKALCVKKRLLGDRHLDNRHSVEIIVGFREPLDSLHLPGSLDPACLLPAF